MDGHHQIKTCAVIVSTIDISTDVFHIDIDLICSLHEAQSGNMCQVDHQAMSYVVKVLSETHLRVYILCWRNDDITEVI